MDVYPIQIMLVDNNRGDAAATVALLQDIKLNNSLQVVRTSSEICAFNQGLEHTHKPKHPDIIFFESFCSEDDNMGILQQMCEYAHQFSIPCVTLFDSKEAFQVSQKQGIHTRYHLTKPLTLNSLMQVIQHIDNFYLKIIRDLPQ